MTVGEYKELENQKIRLKEIVRAIEWCRKCRNHKDALFIEVQKLKPTRHRIEELKKR